MDTSHMEGTSTLQNAEIAPSVERDDAFYLRWRELRGDGGRDLRTETDALLGRDRRS